MELKIEGITKLYKHNTALNNFTCDLNPGIYGLVGPNGAGKTTLLRILATIIKPSKGRILINGKDITLNEDNYREIIGYLPQKLGFYRDYTVTKFLNYIGYLKDVDKNEATDKINNLLNLLNLDQYKDKKIKTLSEGIKQRIGIAQALLNNPKILIFDEPTLNLDPKERINFKNIISRLSSDKIIIISTHIISDIEYLSKEIILIQNGEKIIQNTPVEILKIIKDTVWEADIKPNSLLELQKNFSVTDIKNNGENIKVRIISEKKPNVECHLTNPTLDDLYMFYFGLEGN
ncbi:ABC transporter ATP-binding protein [Vallitalea longa]|uniref:ABC transporter ATP-binding protein n=1 Tax=Vallitalea longa TaxID=2936439 RepID=A0A9W5YH86_9FIRM|nr:ATP-binding cassette domain-containing protein [Vallitalea longa]GKX32243.1 ABC transporter ATP-binding protein [Vallitalea longa]